MTSEIVLDGRRRTSLARVGRREHSRYLAETLDDGTIILSPAVTVSAIELAALRNPELRSAFERARDPDPKSLRRRQR